MGYVQQQIVTFVHEYLDNMKDRLKYDRTEFGKVVSGISDSKEYKVEINDKVVTCRIKNGVTVTSGDVVIVKVPNNNPKYRYIDGKLAK
jgi:hypothetical protein